MTLGLALILWGAPRLPAQVGIGLSPMRLDLRLTPGVPQSGALSLSNEVSAPLHVRAELLDFWIDSKETPQFARSSDAEGPYSCRKWLTVTPMETDIGPTSGNLVRYTLRPPVDLKEGSYHCAAGFSTMPTAQQIGEIGIKSVFRVVVVFYGLVGNPRIEGRLKEVKLEPLPKPEGAEQPAWQAVVVVENQGLRYFRPTGKLAVLDAEGKAIEELPLRSLPVLPKRRQRFLVPLKAIHTSGRYVLRARVDLGSREIQEGVVEVVADAPTN